MTFWPRLHLLEFHEQPWVPQPIRRYVQEFLQHFWSDPSFLTGLKPLLTKALKETGSEQVIDICAGGSGPWKALLPLVRDEIKHATVILTDYYPNLPLWKKIAASTPGLEYMEESIDATDVPAHASKGFRTLFASFHHFKPDMAQAIIEDAVKHRDGIALFEISSRDIQSVLSKFIVSPLIAWRLAFSGKGSWSHFFLSTFFPIGILEIIVDGIVSDLRTYRPEELRAFVDNIKGSEAYDWEIGNRRLSSALPSFMIAPYLIGVPKKEKAKQ